MCPLNALLLHALTLPSRERICSTQILSSLCDISVLTVSQNDHGEIRGNIRCRNILVYVMLSQNDHGEIHGNIRCRNILVYCHERRTFRVKLADVGLVHYYNSLLRDDRVNLDR